MKTALLLSGGVDSSVALHLLKEQGHEVEAFYIKIWLADDLSFLGDCPWEEDLSYCEKITRKLNIPLRIIPFQKEYEEKVVQSLLEELQKGHTPSPDIWCNERIKFGLFMEAIKKYGNYQKVASGHYAKIEELNETYYLKTAKDSLKDQTYFLSRLSQKQLSRILFPLGNYRKEEVRELAKYLGFPNQNRKDSQGICFLGKISYRDFVKHYLGEKKGDIMDVDQSKKIGTHMGSWFYTIGQRQGLGLSGGPWFVCDKNYSSNIVYISHQDHIKKHQKDYLFAHDFHWISNDVPKVNETLTIKIRHSPNSTRGMILNMDKEKSKIQLTDIDQGIAHGQLCIFYKDNTCLGSAFICPQ